jgi:hypothetical protein
MKDKKDRLTWSLLSGLLCTSLSSLVQRSRDIDGSSSSSSNTIDKQQWANRVIPLLCKYVVSHDCTTDSLSDPTNNILYLGVACVFGINRAVTSALSTFTEDNATPLIGLNQNKKTDGTDATCAEEAFLALSTIISTCIHCASTSPFSSSHHAWIHTKGSQSDFV